MKRGGRIVALFNRQVGKCAYTGEDMTLELGHDNTATIDHIVPKSVIGKAFRDFNEVACCHWVNQLKGDKPVSDVIGVLYRMREIG